MALFGIEWAPLNIPLARRLQTLAVTMYFVILVFGPLIGYAVTLYTIVYTQFWWLAVIYLVYVYLDDACDDGRRWSDRQRNWAWWRYFRDYFPLRLVKTVDLDPKRNYLLCVYPHGVLSMASFCAFATNALNVEKLFPGLKTHMLTLHQHFKSPLSREVGIGLGAMSASENAIKNILSHPGGGRVAALVVGGAAEALMSRHNMYRILLKRRKGFCRLALQEGAPLVPVFCFGENRVYDQVRNEPGSTLYRFQEFLRRHIGLAPVIIRGRGIFQYTFGLLPHRRPVTVVVGEPLEVERVPHPTNEQIEELHQRFTDALRAHYDKHQRQYHGGEDIPLVIE